MFPVQTFQRVIYWNVLSNLFLSFDSASCKLYNKCIVAIVLCCLMRIIGTELNLFASFCPVMAFLAVSVSLLWLSELLNSRPQLFPFPFDTKYREKQKDWRVKTTYWYWTRCIWEKKFSSGGSEKRIQCKTVGVSWKWLIKWWRQSAGGKKSKMILSAQMFCLLLNLKVMLYPFCVLTSSG